MSEVPYDLLSRAISLSLTLLVAYYGTKSTTITRRHFRVSYLLTAASLIVLVTLSLVLEFVAKLVVGR